MYERNPYHNAPQEHSTRSNLVDVGGVAVRIHVGQGELVLRTMSTVDEAMVKACGVTMAKPLGHSGAPSLTSVSKVNVGTLSSVSHRHVAVGKARSQPMPTMGGGGPVVVRGRESRPHGEGVQQGCMPNGIQGGRR